MENLEGLSEEEKKLEKDIKKETEKLEYYLGDTEELIESGDFKEMANVCKRTDEILDRLNDLVSRMQELMNVMFTHREKYDNGKRIPRRNIPLSSTRERELVEEAGEEGERAGKPNRPRVKIWS